MFTVSCYAFHPLVLKFVRIWRYTQVVSEVLTCILSMLCCQCMNMLLMKNDSSIGSILSVQRFKDDFQPNTTFSVAKGEGDYQQPQTTAIEIKTEQHAAKGKELQDVMERPLQKQICSTRHLQTTTSFWTHKLKDKNNIVAIHSTRKLNRKGILMPTSNLYIK